MLMLSRGDRKISAVPDDVYDIIVQILSGKFHKPVNGRSRIEINALLRVYRLSRHSIEIKHEKDVYIDGKKLLRKSELDNAVEKTVKKLKGASYRNCAKIILLSSVGSSANVVKRALTKKSKVNLRC